MENLRSFNLEVESSHATEERLIGFMPYEISHTSSNYIHFRKEGQPVKDTELEIEHKLNEMRVNMYFDYDLDAVFYFSQDSVTEQSNQVPPSSSSLEESTAATRGGSNPRSNCSCYG